MTKNIEYLSSSFNPFKARADWDMLLVVDACRFDVFQEVNSLPGVLKKWRSSCSCTQDFVSLFDGLDLRDMVCLSANPHISNFYLKKLPSGIPFYSVRDVWDWGWDKKLGTVRPDVVTQAVIEQSIAMSDKKFYVHYLQPHHPFIGKFKIREKGVCADSLGIPAKHGRENLSTVYDLLKEGKISKESVFRAYKDNLKLVLKSIEKLRRPGVRIVINKRSWRLFW